MLIEKNRIFYSLHVWKGLGLSATLPARSRNDNIWFRGDYEVPEAIKNQLGINIDYRTLHIEIILLLTKMIDYGL